jgi:tetratricopeptide (TPR) repeat protein
VRLTAIVLAMILAASHTAGGQSQLETPLVIKQLLQNRDYDRALTLSDSLLKQEPKNAQLLLMRALALRGLGRKMESLKAFNQVLLLKPNDVAALEGASEAAFLLKDPAAWDLVQNLIRLTPTNTVANAMAGTQAYERGDCAQAVNYFASGKPALVNDVTATLQYSQCLLIEGQASAAVSMLERIPAVESDPTISYDLAFALFSAGRYIESVARLEHLKANGHGDAEVLDLLASGYGKLDRVQDALDAYREACEAAPTSPEYYIDLVFFAMEHSSDGAALKVLDTAIERMPRSSELLTVRGSIYSFIGEPGKAEQDFKRAEEVDPTSGYGVVGRSLSVRDQGKSSEAETELREELKKHPDDIEAEYFLAQIMMNDDTASNYAEARSLLEAVQRKRPNDPNVLLTLGTTYLEQKDPKAALPLLIHAQQLDPTGVSILNRLLQVYRALQMKDQAVNTANELRQLVDQNRSAEAHRNRFHIAASTNDPVTAPAR